MKVNFGSGNDYINGWVNLDKGNCKKDIDHDLFEFPWPFEDSSVEKMKFQHIFEHFSKQDFHKIMKEIYRIGKNGCQIFITSPYALSDNFFTDPTHQLPLTSRTFDFFDRSKQLFENGKIYGWDDINLIVKIARLIDNPPSGPDIQYVLEIVK